MDKDQYHTAKVRLVAQMQVGQSWQVAAATVRVQISQSTTLSTASDRAKVWRGRLQDGRHGHPVKLRGAARTFLEEHCQQVPSTPSSVIQALLQERFDLGVSITQINRVRAALGLSNHPVGQRQEKNSSKRNPSSSRMERRGGKPSAACGGSSDEFARRVGDRSLFTTLAELAQSLESASHPGLMRQRLRRYIAFSLLVIDEVGYTKLSQEQAHHFFELVTARYEHGSIILTSNTSFTGWGGVTGR